jgi:hypothetical protein
VRTAEDVDELLLQAHEDVAREPKDCFGNFGDGQESARLRAACPDISLKNMNRFVWMRAGKMGEMYNPPK